MRAALLLGLTLAQLTGCAALPGAAGEGMPTLADAGLMYVGELCRVPLEERAPLVQEFNEAASPNAISVYCGTGSSGAP